MSSTLTQSGISAENYAFLQAQVHRDSGIVLDETKLYLIESRLTPLVSENGLNGLDALCAALRVPGSDTLRRRVVEAMTTNETLFFRDATAFDALQTHTLPSLVEQRQSARRLSIWSAAASSGQEAYSLAMMLLEMGLPGWELRVFATDLNHQILERAKAGVYRQIEVNRGLPARFLARYFVREGLEWKVTPQVRSLVEFAPFDLRDSMTSFGPFDLVLCRNVLIYFDAQTKRRILASIRRTLQPGGMLLLGCSESILYHTADYERVTHGSAMFYKAA